MALTFLAIAAPVSAQQRPIPRGPIFVERVDLGTVSVAVTDDDGRPVAGLTAADFELREDGEPEEIVVFLDQSDKPLELAVVLDASGSIERNVPQIRPLLREFLGALRPGDCFLLLPFSADVGPGFWNVDIDAFTNDFELGGGTRLYDALLSALGALGDEAREVDGLRGPRHCGNDSWNPWDRRRAVVVVTDGEDTSSVSTLGEALRKTWEAGIPVIVMIVGQETNFVFSRPTRQQRRANSQVRNQREVLKDMEELASVSGGRLLRANSARRQRQRFEEILALLRSSYLLGYRIRDLEESGPPAWRPIDVRVDRRGVNVSAPEGLYARINDAETSRRYREEGTAAMDAGDLATAANRFEIATRFDWESARAHYYRALAAAQMNERDLAQAAIAWAHFFDPLDPAIRALRRDIAGLAPSPEASGAVTADRPAVPEQRASSGALDPAPIARSIWVATTSHRTLPRQQAAVHVSRMVSASLPGLGVELIRRPRESAASFGLLVRIRDIERDGEIQGELSLLGPFGERVARESFDLAATDARMFGRDAPPVVAGELADKLGKLLSRLPE